MWWVLVVVFFFFVFDDDSTFAQVIRAYSSVTTPTIHSVQLAIMIERLWGGDGNDGWWMVGGGGNGDR